MYPLSGPLAVVGLACRLPNADSVEHFWESLKAWGKNRQMEKKWLKLGCLFRLTQAGHLMTSELPVLSGQIPRKGVGSMGAVGAVAGFLVGKKRCHLGTLRQVLFQTLASTATSGSARNKLLSAGTNGTMEHSTWHNAMKSHTERGYQMASTFGAQVW